MSGPSGSLASRPLSTTEELEKLEQSITLTLQEIDSNFSKAHRIVTGSILPVVEQYGEHCRSVWDASKFWKQFFEAAANVSLSGYEELANDGDSTGVEETTTATHDETSTTYTPRRRRNDGEDGEHGGDDQTATGYHGGARDDSLLTDGDGDLSGGTPRPPTATVSQHPQFADMNSPYENLRREMNHGGGERSGGAQSRSRSGSRPRPADNDDADESTMMQFGESNEDNFKNDRFDSSAAESELLVQRTARLPDMSMTPRPSLDERNRRVLEDEQATARRMKDPLMHRVLGKDYRIQATPHKNTARGISPMRLRVEGRDTKESTKDAAAKQAAPPWQSSPMSSPEMAVPKLRSAAFLSPMRAAYRSKLTATVSGPRTPGVSVQTLARSKPREMHFDDIETTETATKKPATDAAEGANKKKQKKERDEITWESSDEDGDDDLYGGFSPPKTISFAQLPSKLLQTPAREASKRIVEDIMLTAGEDVDRESEYSPTMVKMNADILDETF